MYRVQGLGFKVLRFRVKGLRFRVSFGVSKGTAENQW